MKKLKITSIIALLIFNIYILKINAIPSIFPKDTIKVKAEEINKWVSFMASDEMKGRKNGTKELKIVSNWIKKQFIDADLSIPNGLQDYFQEYTMNYSNIIERNVIGFLEGSDPNLKNEIILISAHYDHIGTRTPINGDWHFLSLRGHLNTFSSVPAPHAACRRSMEGFSQAFSRFIPRMAGLFGRRYPAVYVDNRHR